MKKSTIIGGIIFIIIFSLTVYVGIDKYNNKKDSKEKEKNNDKEVLIGDININIEDIDDLKKSNSTNYNIEVLNKVESYLKNNIDFNDMSINDSKVINSADIVKNDNCNGDVIVSKLINGIYSVDINNKCKNNNKEDNSFSFKLLGNLDNNGDLYTMENIEGNIIGISNKSNGTKDVSASIIKFDDNLNIEWLYSIDDKAFNIREDNGLKVVKILKSKDYYYILGYLNDDFGSVFGVKLDDDGNLEWQKVIDPEMVITDAFILSNKLVIMNSNDLNFINEKGVIEETIVLDYSNPKLSNYRLGRVVYYNNNIYGMNSKNSLNYAEFNSSGLLNSLYDVSDKVTVDGYLVEVKAYDNKLFLNYDDGNLVLVDIFGRFIGNIKSENEIKVGINSHNFDIINYEDKYYEITKYDYNLKEEEKYKILGIGNKNNIYNTDTKFYQYITSDDYIVFAQFDK